jgi:hypothetical protein
MAVLKVSHPHSRGGPLTVASVALAATLIASPWLVATTGAEPVPDVAVKAACLYNFARFVEWSSPPVGAPIDVDAADDSGLHASSRLLGFAKVIRSAHAQ